MMLLYFLCFHSTEHDTSNELSGHQHITLFSAVKGKMKINHKTNKICAIKKLLTHTLTFVPMAKLYYRVWICCGLVLVLFISL